MASWQEQDVDTGRIRLHVRRLAGDGRPLALLHGLGVAGAVWQAFGRRLAPAWSVVAPDLRGHGQSEHPAGGYEPADYAADVLALVDALGLVRPVVLGHSLGALVGLAMAAAAPPRVAALILVDPPLDPALVNPEIEQVYRLRHAPPGELERYLVEGGNAPLVARALASLFRQADDRAFESHLRAAPGAPWAWDAAASIQSPVLVVQADPAEGGALGIQAATEFTARLPHGVLVPIPGARHAVHASHPAELADAVVDFLETA